MACYGNWLVVILVLVITVLTLLVMVLILGARFCGNCCPRDLGAGHWFRFGAVVDVPVCSFSCSF
jgi:hypothetical protein